MVNDFLNELYIEFNIPHLVWLLESPITIDRFQVSIAMAMESRIAYVGRPGSPEMPGFPGFQGDFGHVDRTGRNSIRRPPTVPMGPALLRN